MTKEKILELLAQYNPGILRFFRFRKSRSDEMDDISQIVNGFPAGEISQHNLIMLIGAINNYTRGSYNRETGRIFNLINSEIALELAGQAVQKDNIRKTSELIQTRLANGLDRNISAHLFQLWRNSYYFERSHKLQLMLHEIFGIHFGEYTSQIENSCALILLSISLYETLLERPNSIVSAYFSQISIQSLLALTQLNNYTTSSINGYLQRFATNLLSLQWWLGLGLNAGLDFMRGTGGELVCMYIGATAVQSLLNKLRHFISPPAWYRSTAQNYPVTMTCMNQYLSDVTFGIGAYLGKTIYSGVTDFNHSKQKEFHSGKENKKESKHENRQKNNQTNHDSSKQKSSEDARNKNPYEEKHSDEKSSKPSGSSFDPKICAKFIPIQLSEREKKLVSKETECKINRDECLSVIYKIARLNPQSTHDKKVVKRSIKDLTLLWHPDKFPKECIDAQNNPAEQVIYLNEAREMLNCV